MSAGAERISAGQISAERISVDRDRCCGAGRCVATAPTVFDQAEDDGLVVLLRSAPRDPAEAEAAYRAADLCPSGAVRVER